MNGRMTLGRRCAAVMTALVLLFSLSGTALGANQSGLVVEKLSFRDVLRLYTADRASFGENALETDAGGITNAAKNLSVMFAYTVGLNYTGEGNSANYFGKDITSQMDKEPYTGANLLATYAVEIVPYRSRANALPEGKTTNIRVYLTGYKNAASGVEPVLHYVWMDQGRWMAVKDDNPYYKVSFNGQSARESAYTIARNHSGSDDWQRLADAQLSDGVVHLSGSTLVAGEGTASVFGVTESFESLTGQGGINGELTAVSDYVQGDSKAAVGPLVFSRDCYEDGTLRRISDGESLRPGTVYRYTVVYDEALRLMKGKTWADAGLTVTPQSGTVENFVWYGDAAFLTGDKYNPHTIEFTFAPSGENAGICTFRLEALVGSDSGLRASEFYGCTAAGELPPAAATVTPAPAATPAPMAAPAVTPAPVPPAVQSAATPAPAATPSAMTQATTLPLLTVGGGSAVVTRGVLAEALWVLSGKPVENLFAAFTDLTNDNQQNQAIAWACAVGLMSDAGDGSFGTQDPVTRRQAADLFRRYAAYRGADTAPNGDLSAYSDSTGLGETAAAAFRWALGSGVLSPRNGLIAPDEPILCGEATSSLYRLQQLG